MAEDTNTCPHIKGSIDGALCKIANSFIRQTAGADIHICLSDHFTYCPIFRGFNEQSLGI